MYILSPSLLIMERDVYILLPLASIESFWHILFGTDSMSWKAIMAFLWVFLLPLNVYQCRRSLFLCEYTVWIANSHLQPLRCRPTLIWPPHWRYMADSFRLYSYLLSFWIIDTQLWTVIQKYSWYLSGEITIRPTIWAYFTTSQKIWS